MTPPPLAAVASRISARASLLEMLDPGTSNCTVAYAMCPSADTCPGTVYGSVTPVTPAALRNGTRAAATRARTAADVIPSSDRMASVSVSPDCAAKCSLSSVCPGSFPVKSFCAAAPNRVQSPMRQTTPATHTSTVTHRCR